MALHTSYCGHDIYGDDTRGDWVGGDLITDEIDIQGHLLRVKYETTSKDNIYRVTEVQFLELPYDMVTKLVALAENHIIYLFDGIQEKLNITVEYGSEDDINWCGHREGA